MSRLLGQIDMMEVTLESKPAFNYISDLEFDDYDVLWMSTARGLYQIDGYDSKYFVFDPSDSLALNSNIVHDVMKTKDSSVWVLTGKGLQSYDHANETFHKHLEDFQQIEDDLYKKGNTAGIEISDCELLLGTKAGVIQYNYCSKQYIFTEVIKDKWRDGYSSSNHIVDIVQDQTVDHLFYLLSRGGIIRYNSEDRSFIELPIDKSIDFRRLSPPGFAIRNHNQKLYFIVHWALISFDLESQKTTVLIDRINGEARQIRDFEVLNDSLLIVSTTKVGIYQLNLRDKNELKLLSDGRFNQITIDRKGYLWSAKSTKSLVRSTLPIRQMPNYQQSLEIRNFWINGIVQAKRDYDLTKTITLDKYQRELFIELSLANPHTQEDLRYEYRWNETDSLWKELPLGRRLEIKDLNPGKHSFHFRVSQQGKVLDNFQMNCVLERYFYEKWWFKLGLVAIFLLLASLIYYLLWARKKDKKIHKNELLTMELNALRAQMNPHFLFNTLNSIKNYVLTKDPDEAAEFLTKFAQLIRSILENSKSSLLTLDQELHSLNLYLEMEQLRFDNQFEFSIDIEDGIDSRNVKIAPMIIQPFVENAIWHGLMNKNGDRKLSLQFSKAENGILCVVEDNGIGRVEANKLHSRQAGRKKSLGMEITKNRLNNINQIYGLKAYFEIADVIPTGTRVNIFMPTIKASSQK